MFHSTYQSVISYVPLTDVNGNRMWVNGNAVLSVETHCQGCRITLDSHDPTCTRIVAKETPDRVVQLLTEDIKK